MAGAARPYDGQNGATAEPSAAVALRGPTTMARWIGAGAALAVGIAAAGAQTAPAKPSVPPAPAAKAAPAQPGKAAPGAKPAAAPAAPAAPAGVTARAAMPMAPITPAAKLAELRVKAVEAYNARDWQAAAESADEFVAALDGAGLPHIGADFALVSFLGGHARFELWRRAPGTFKYDYDKDVLGAMTASLAILQDDPFFKHSVLGAAYYEKLKAGGYRDVELENWANWHMEKALAARAEELEGKPRDGAEFAAFDKFLLQYVGRALEMARRSPVADVYLIRVRDACRLGFGGAYDERFAQFHQVVGFDDGNVRAGAAWQAGLDMMVAEGSAPADVLATFREAAEATRGVRERAEVYRQMSDYASRQDGYEYKQLAVEYGRTAFRLDPGNAEIQQQFGSALHVVSFAQFNSARYEEALRAAQEATSFAWEGDEAAYYDLARALANHGDKVGAVDAAETAYARAAKRLKGAEVAPFRTNYVNILRQFGFAAKAAAVEAEGPRS